MSMKHPFDAESFYELMDDGTIQVSRGDLVGRFSSEGVFLSGEIRESDPQLCNWVSNVTAPETQKSTSRIAGRDNGEGL